MEIGPFKIDRSQLLVADLDPSGVMAVVQLSMDLQAGTRRCAGDQVDDDFVTHQGPTAPVLGAVLRFNFVNGGGILHNHLKA